MATKVRDRVVVVTGASPGGAHGDFDTRAKGWSAELWLGMNRGRVAAAAIGFAAALVGYRAATA